MSNNVNFSFKGMKVCWKEKDSASIYNNSFAMKLSAILILVIIHINNSLGLLNILLHNELCIINQISNRDKNRHRKEVWITFRDLDKSLDVRERERHPLF